MHLFYAKDLKGIPPVFLPFSVVIQAIYENMLVVQYFIFITISYHVPGIKYKIRIKEYIEDKLTNGGFSPLHVIFIKQLFFGQTFITV